MEERKKQWDVFISHASEDKDDFVRNLANNLKSYGLKVWYDEFSLNIGDSLFQSINNGIKNSNYGIIIISRIYLKKYWTQNELNGFFAAESSTNNLIIPIWHSITKDEVFNYSPILADKMAIMSSEPIVKIVLKIIEKVKPQLSKHIHARLVFNKMVSEGKKKIISIKKIKKSPIRYDKLPQTLLLRIRLVRAVFLEVSESSFEKYVDNFQRDLYPHDEIERWEIMAFIYLETLFRFSIKDISYKKEIFKYIISLACNDNYISSLLSEEIMENIKLSDNFVYPIWDFKYDKISEYYL